jgi:uncharacterized membrane protein
MDSIKLISAAAHSRKRLLNIYRSISLIGICILIGRQFLGTEKAFLFLLWNFLLAGLPLILSSVMIQMDDIGTRTRVMLLMGFFWLLFLPNAPYMVTDFIHLRYGSRAFFLLDILTLAWFAIPAFIAATISINDISGLLLKRYQGWQVSLIVLMICGLCSFGIYLGRDLRFNSWDMLLDPGAVMTESMEHLSNPYADMYTWIGSALIGLLLFMIYQTGKMMRRMF